jgi:siroheme synthase
MGAHHLAEIAAKIIDGGLAANTPVALVSRASWPDQEIRFFSLGEFVTGTHPEASTPALVIIGEVARIPAETAALAMATAVAV